MKLTPKEREVYELVIQGRTTQQIAAILGKTESTVSNQRAAIKRKLGAKNFGQLLILSKIL